MGKRFPRALLAAALLAAAGCVALPPARPADPVAPPPPEAACVYGRFERVDGWPILFYLLLEYGTPDGESLFEIELLPGREVRAFLLPAGVYRLRKLLLATSCLGLKAQTETDVQEFPVGPGEFPPHSEEFLIRAGEALYLGNFRAAVVRESCGPAGWIGARFEGVEDRFEETTAALRRAYPGLGELPARRARWE